MQKIPKQEYTTEFKERAVKYVKGGEIDWLGGLGAWSSRTNTTQLGDGRQAHWRGYQASHTGQMDLSRLRAENVRLKRECEILKKPRRTSREL